MCFPTETTPHPPPPCSVQLYHFNIHLTSLSCHYQINEYKRFNQKMEGERRHLLWTLACNKYNNVFFLIRRLILIRFQIIIYINTYDSCRGVLTHTHTHTKVHLHSRQHTQTCTQTQAHISRGCLSLFAVVAFQVFFISSHGEFACLVNSK